MMQIAVTGGRGFIGERLVKRLVERGDRVRILTRKSGTSFAGVEQIIGDLTHSNDVLKRFVEGADILFHCAGEIRDPARMHALHVEGTRRLIEAARGKVGKWIQLSSVGVYGPVTTGVVREDWPEAPVGEYERTKAEADRLVRHAAEQNAFPVVLLRPSTVYGPTMRNQSLFQLIKAINQGAFFFIGAPGAMANYIHVENVVDAALQCADNDSANGRIYIVSDQRTQEQFVSHIAFLLKRRPPPLRIPIGLARFIALAGGWLPGFPLTQGRVGALTTRAYYSTERIERELGYVRHIAMEEGMVEMVRHVKPSEAENG